MKKKTEKKNSKKAEVSKKMIEIYSTPSCHYCVLAKDFFKNKGIRYIEYDVAQDLEKRKEMMERSGQMGVPVVVSGEKVIVGFDEDHFTKVFN